VQPGLKGLVDSQPPAREYEEEVAPVEIGGATRRKDYESGRVVYIPAVRFDGRLPDFGKFFTIDARFWRMPKNTRDIAAEVRWAARDNIPVQVAGPAYLVSNLVEQPEKHRMMLHLVNYNAKNAASLEPVPVVCRLPRGQIAKGVTVYSPDSGTPFTPETRNGTGVVSFAVPLKTYSIAVVRW
jgi:hypothetical protein